MMTSLLKVCGVSDQNLWFRVTSQIQYINVRYFILSGIFHVDCFFSKSFLQGLTVESKYQPKNSFRKAS
jgi:hypothetical protein